jgi:hypothetical protein
MPRQHDCAFDALPCETPNPRATHSQERAADSPPRDWSQIGRRVLAEAWRRITEDLAARRTPGPVATVPHPDGEDAK